MKHYRTKNQIWFVPMSITEQLRYRYDQHFHRYQHHPRRIYMTTDEQLKQYEGELPAVLQSEYLAFGHPKAFNPRSGKNQRCMLFRAVPLFIDGKEDRGARPIKSQRRQKKAD